MADEFNVQSTVATMGALCILGVIVALLYQRHVRDRLLPDDETPGRGALTAPRPAETKQAV